MKKVEKNNFAHEWVTIEQAKLKRISTYIYLPVKLLQIKCISLAIKYSLYSKTIKYETNYIGRKILPCFQKLILKNNLKQSSETGFFSPLDVFLGVTFFQPFIVLIISFPLTF